MAKILGHDVSHHQGSINFDTYKSSADSQFLIIKATEGVGYIDPKFKYNQANGRRVQMLLGYYHFARPDLGNSAESEAEYFLKTVGALGVGEILVLDYECANQIQEHVDWCKKWLDYVFNKTGVRAFIYLNQSQVRKFNWDKVIKGDYALWIAAYTYDPNKNDFVTGQWKVAAMQQWTNRQQVPGVQYKVDGNVFFGSLAALRRYGYKSGVVPEPTPVPVNPDLEKLLKKRLTDEAWSMLTEFEELKKLGLIDRADSIQTQTQKWLKQYDGKSGGSNENAKMEGFVEGKETERARIARELGIEFEGQTPEADFSFKAWLDAKNKSKFDKLFGYLKGVFGQ